MQYLRILLSSFGEEDSKVCIEFSMFKLSLAIISPIMQVAPPFEQTLITHTQGPCVCNIIEFCQVVLEKNIFKGLHQIFDVQIVFGW